MYIATCCLMYLTRDQKCSIGKEKRKRNMCRNFEKGHKINVSPFCMIPKVQNVYMYMYVFVLEMNYP